MGTRGRCSGGVRQGEPEDFTTGDLAVQWQGSLAVSVPMTTCFWANYGAAGLVDSFPPACERLPLDETAAQTQEFVTAALARSSSPVATTPRTHRKVHGEALSRPGPSIRRCDPWTLDLTDQQAGPRCVASHEQHFVAYFDRGEDL